MKIEIEITSQKIADQMVTAIEGGSTYWCDSIVPNAFTRALATEKPWYADPKVYEHPGMSIVVREEDAAEGKLVTLAEIKRGLEIMATKTQHFADMMMETGDATTADVFLQCVALGEIVYG